jgi:hypothetical protein
MKSGAIAVCLVTLAAPSQGSGKVNFSTRVPTWVDAPVRTVDGALVGGGYFGQLLAGKSPLNLSPVGVPIPFRTDAGKGYITRGGDIFVPTVDDEPGGLSYVQFVAWSGAPDYQRAVRFLACGGSVNLGSSSIMEVDTAGPDETAVNLVQLRPLFIGSPEFPWDLFYYPKLHINGNISVQFYTVDRVNHVLEASRNLLEWEPVAYFNDFGAIGQFILTNDSPACFFRMQRLGCD